jgi:hypothetical protein
MSEGGFSFWKKRNRKTLLFLKEEFCFFYQKEFLSLSPVNKCGKKVKYKYM